MIIRVGLAVKENALQRHLKRKLSDTDMQVETFNPPRSVWRKALHSGCDVIIISAAFIIKPIDNGIAILNELPENPTTIIIHESDSPEEHARLAAAGADVVLFAGISKMRLYQAIESALESRRQWIQRKRYDRRGVFEPKITDFVTESQAMRIFMEEVHQVIPSDSPILLTGETGVGKEHLAKAIHSESPRSIGPFVAVNTAAMPEQLLESELFGHEQGAFTGAIRYRRGAFELAHGGTIFLDEIGEMPLHLQTKLLGILQDYKVKPIGGENTIELDVRVIAATNQNLEEAIAAGKFRQDLYYRLGVLMLTIPPLRDRREDIPTMTRRFTTYFRYKIGREINGFSDKAMQALCSYDWPGNVRELMNVIERAMLLCKTNEIRMEELPNVFNGVNPDLEALLPGENPGGTDWLQKPLPELQKEIVARVERIYLQRALAKTRGRVGQAARIAGIHPRALYNKMKQLDLRKEAFKQ
ncbi:MAG: sigma-54 dependent transcriptional regulator [Desulfobacterales bacterium]